MGKKNRNDVETSGKKRKNAIIPFSFQNVQLDDIDERTVKRHIFYLIVISIITKFLVLFTTVAVFHSFVDMFDFGYYFDHGLMIINGQIPYVDFSFDYPPLVIIPIIIAIIPALLIRDASAFIGSFQLMMIACDILISISIYFIGLKIYDEKRAFLAAAIYSAAFSTAYFVLTKYDAFPTCLLMVAVLFTIYGMNTKGYIADALGFFAKLFPLIVLPFLVAFNAKKTSLNQELIKTVKIFVPVSLIILVPFIIIKPVIIQQYISASLIRTDVYVNTPTYTLYTVLHGVLALDISSMIISSLMYGVLGIVLLILLFLAFRKDQFGPENLLKFVLLSIFSVVFCMKWHSPQFFLWFTPFICLLIAGSFYKIILFFAVQILTFIEFPLMFGVYYTNVKYLMPVGSLGWYVTLLFFILEYSALILLVYLAVNPSGKFFKKVLRSLKIGNPSDI